MAECIKREADGFKYYVVRNKADGQYFRGKGENKWGKYYNQASIYRFKKHAENAVVELSHRGTQAEVVEIRIAEAADVVEVVHGEWVLEHGDYGKMMCSVCKKEPPTEKRPDPYEDYQMTEFYITSDYCPNCGAKMNLK